MNRIQFIEDNIRKSLIQQGYTLAISQRAAFEAVGYYRRMSQASKKGGMFEDLLRHARLWADRNSLPGDRVKK